MVKYVFGILLPLFVGSALFSMKQPLELIPLLSEADTQASLADNNASTIYSLGSLIFNLPTEIVAKLSHYLPGDNYFLNYYLARHIKPDTKTTAKIIKAFIRYLLQKTDSKNPRPLSLLSALGRITQFFKTTKFADEHNVLFNYWNPVRELGSAIKTYDEERVHSALKRYLKKYQEQEPSYLKVFDTLQEEVLFDQFIVKCYKVSLRQRFSRTHIIADDTKCVHADCCYDNISKKYWCTKVIQNPTLKECVLSYFILPCLFGLPAIVCLGLAFTRENPLDQTLFALGCFLLLCANLSHCSLCYLLIKERDWDREVDTLRAEYKDKLKALILKLTAAHNHLQKYFEDQQALAGKEV